MGDQQAGFVAGFLPSGLDVYIATSVAVLARATIISRPLLSIPASLRRNHD